MALARETNSEKIKLECELCGNSNTAADHIRLAEITELLKGIDDRAVEGSIIRSKEQWTELGAKPTKYFYQLEQQRQSKNSINELCVGNVSLTSTRDILHACHGFYSDLYTAEPMDLPCQDWLLAQLDQSA